MNIKRSIHTTLATAVAVIGLSGPAMAMSPAPTQLSNGPVKPTVVWDHAAWKKCWKATYIQWREDGASPNASSAAADLVCGDPPA